MYIFDKDIELKQKNEFDFEGVITPNWSINGNPNSGYLTAFCTENTKYTILLSAISLSVFL
jgi:hypothetical protein